MTVVRSEGTNYMARDIGKAPVASVDVLRYARLHGLTIQYQDGRAYVIATLGKQSPTADGVWHFRDQAEGARALLEGRGRRPAYPHVA